MNKGGKILNYCANIPIKLEFISTFDNFEFNFNYNIEIKKSFCLEGIFFSIEYKSKGNKIIHMAGIKAKNEISAFIVAENWLKKICPLLSWFIQKENKNQHIGHCRILWFSKDIKITPRDSSDSEKLEIELLNRINLTHFEELLTEVVECEDLSYILDQFYGALQSYDIKAKFYRAFTIMEYLEKKYREQSGERIFNNETHLNEIGNIIYKTIMDFGYDKKYAEKAKSHLCSYFTNVTKENRAKKLNYILTNILEIKEVEYQDKYQINEKLIKDFINIRNKQYHAGDILSTEKLSNDFIREKCNILILICEQVINRLLKNRVD